MTTDKGRLLARVLIVIALDLVAQFVPVRTAAAEATSLVHAAPVEFRASDGAGDIKSVAAGYDHVCVLTAAGSVQCWGSNAGGQLGDGTQITRLMPVDVWGLGNGVQAIAAGGDHTCALTASGGVKCWGWNDRGQLGDGTTIARLLPVDVAGLGSGVQAITAGSEHTCAVTTGGGVKCWGKNSDGQLGDGTQITRLAPVDVAGLGSGVQNVAAGYVHTCALTAAGAVKCWGGNEEGQLGDGTIDSRLAPANVVGLGGGVTDIATGAGHSCALNGEHTMLCWGANYFGQLGDGTTINRLTPVPVASLQRMVSSIAAGFDHTCAIAPSMGGYIKCWGGNGYGQLGNGTTSGGTALSTVVGIGNEVEVLSAGRYFTCATLSGGRVVCWGSNVDGQLGDGTAADRLAPVDVSGLGSGVQDIAAGSNHTCAVTAAGAVTCWGENWAGQLGDSTTTARWTLANVAGLGSGMRAVAADLTHTCALTAGGGVKCWGGNEAGQLGDGTRTDRLTPVNTSGLGSGVQAVATGVSHTCALTTGGGVKCWGSNRLGALGDGTETDRLTPVDVVGLGSDVQSIAAGGSHTCALTAGGAVKCWGENWAGQLGDGTRSYRTTPANVVGLGSGVRAIAAGHQHTCALTVAGGVKCWGSNASGRLGDGTTSDRLTPVDVSGLGSGALSIAAGSAHSCAATAGAMKCWGGNGHGELGDGTRTDRWTPTDVIGLGGGVEQISAGYSHTCVVAYGGVKCWGWNGSGQLALNPGWTPLPVRAFPASETLLCTDGHSPTDPPCAPIVLEVPVTYTGTLQVLALSGHAGASDGKIDAWFDHIYPTDANPPNTSVGFALGLALEPELVAGAVSTHVREAFQAHGVTLGPSAAIVYGTRWTIQDACQAYYLHKQAQDIAVYVGSPVTLWTGKELAPGCARGVATADGRNGVDFAPPGNTAAQRAMPVAVLAAAAGAVVEVDDLGRGNCATDDGCYVMIDHGSGFATRYAHLAMGSISVHRGDATIPVLYPLGLMGNTGKSSAKQLHFSVYFDRNGDGRWGESEVVDPFGWMPVLSDGGQVDPWLAHSGMQSIYLWRSRLDVPRVIGPAGGSLLSGSRTVDVLVPPGAVGADLTLALVDAPVAELPDGLRSAGRSFLLHAPASPASGAAQTLDLQKPVTVSVNYADADVRHLDEAQLRLARWRSDGSAWVELPGQVDARQNTVSTATTELGGFALMGPLLCADDTFEPNDDTYSASLLAAGVSLPAQVFDSHADEDWLRLQVDYGTVFEVRFAAQGSGVRGSLALFAPDGVTQLAGGENVDRLTWIAAGEGAYYLRVTPAAGGATGCSATYTLTMTALDTMRSTFLVQVHR